MVVFMFSIKDWMWFFCSCFMFLDRIYGLEYVFLDI